MGVFATRGNGRASVEGGKSDGRADWDLGCHPYRSQVKLPDNTFNSTPSSSFNVVMLSVRAIVASLQVSEGPLPPHPCEPARTRPDQYRGEHYHQIAPRPRCQPRGVVPSDGPIGAALCCDSCACSSIVNVPSFINAAIFSSNAFSPISTQSGGCSSSLIRP